MGEMADTKERVKEKLTIQDVVSPYVKLTRSGKYLKGLSPFNKEKTPSFFVNPERGSYYCFSSGQGGDMFTFIEKMEGVDFKGALKILAEKAGVPLEYSGGSKESKEKTDRLREAMARAEQFFSRNLTEDSSPYAYARSRGLTPATITAWSLGFAPDGWRGLLEELSKAGFSVEELNSAGLVKEADGKAGTYYDRFRNRLMFPIADSAGRTVAFTGRALDPKDEAKYLNSPETDLFKKSTVLFAMHRAKDAIRTRGYALLMEGQMDVLHAHQAGFENTVGLSGTALTPNHLALLSRYSDNLMLCLDGDRAGLAATHKHALAALAAGMRVKAVRLPLGKDPADLITEDKKVFAEQVAEAKPIVEFFLSVLSETEKDSHRMVLSAERIILPLLRAVKSPMEREHFIGVVARFMNMTPEAIRESMKRAPLAEGEERPKGAPQNPQFEAIPDEVLLLAVAQVYKGMAIANRVESEYSRITGRTLEGESPERVLFETGILYGEAPSEHAADDTLKRFERRELDRAYQDALELQRRAEASGDKDAAREAESKLVSLIKAKSTL
jgi:DNA primase